MSNVKKLKRVQKIINSNSKKRFELHNAKIEKLTIK